MKRTLLFLLLLALPAGASFAGWRAGGIEGALFAIPLFFVAALLASLVFNFLLAVWLLAGDLTR